VRLIYASLILLTVLISGCAGLEAPNPERFVPPWSGANALRLGDKKDYVISQWGEPDTINQIGVDEVGLVKEEWIYSAGKLPVIEVEPRMLVKGQNLIFTGNTLTGYEKKYSE
jgi:hypothetical protein